MSNTNNDVTIGGKWKILGKQYQGDLTFNKTNGIIILSIYYKDNEEFLAWMDKPTEITTITGKLNQEIKCTLVDCQIVKRHSDGFVRHHIVIVAKNMFINISKSEKSDIKFNEVHFQIPNIIKWSQLSGFEYMDDPSYTFKIGYKFKDTISEKIDDNTTIEFVPVFGKFNFDMQIESLDISQHVEVRIKKKEEKSYEEFFKDFDMIMNLITLATGLKINVSLVQGINYKKYTAKVGKKYNYINDVYNALIVRDIQQKYNIQNIGLMDSLTEFMMDNVSNLTSYRKIANILNQASINTNDKTIANYINYLCDAFAFYKIRRYDIQGKRYLSSVDKYYLVDQTFKYAKLGTKNMNYGRIYENIVAIELLRRGYEIYVGELYNAEVDFVAMKMNEKIYVQVSDNISDDKTFEREVRPLLKIKDAYPKILIARTRHDDYQYEGIQIYDLANWLLK